jgi:hypothetical protein
MKLVAWVWAALRTVLLAFAAMLLFLEEWGWRPLAAWLGRFTRWPPWARFEARIAGLPPHLALWVFLAPIVLLLPVKLLALALLQEGRTGLGLGVILAAKLVGTAIGGRLFVLTEPQLMRLRRFAQVMHWWRRTRRRVRRAVNAWPRWRAMRAAMRRWRLRLRRFVHTR